MKFHFMKKKFSFENQNLTRSPYVFLMKGLQEMTGQNFCDKSEVGGGGKNETEYLDDGV